MAVVGAVAVALAVLGAAAAEAASPEPGEPGYGVRFNQHLLEEVKKAPELDVDDAMDVFGHVFAALPDEAYVYPTENYYYFTFFHDGMEYAGNLRLDVADRDDGVLHFAYYPQNTPWSGETATTYRPLTRADGVSVSRLDELVYEVAFVGRSVRFALNDLSDVEPPEAAVREDEIYLGPVFDEAGIGFYLLFDEARSEFLFVLNEETAGHDRFKQVHRDHPALHLGSRTGFAVYDDRFAPRRLLVGVYLENVLLNNYFDGPFDQLPDNFIEGDALERAIVAKHPDLESEIDRFGGFRAHDGRFLVNPYINYSSLDELRALLRCSDPALNESRFYACLLPEDGD